MKKQENSKSILEESVMQEMEDNVQDLEDQKQVLYYTRKISMSNADAIRALFVNDETLNSI